VRAVPCHRPIRFPRLQRGLQVIRQLIQPIFLDRELISIVGKKEERPTVSASSQDFVEEVEGGGYSSSELAYLAMRRIRYIDNNNRME
jgi:hypothetical protein